MTEIDAAKAMIATTPTTREGLQAFADYLREERQRHVGMHVRGPGGIEALIARRTAEIG